MSEFSDMLESFVVKKGINKYQMAKYISIDRSSLHKIITGQRNAPSKELVLRMAKYLELSMKETEDLLELYNISTISPKIYYRNKQIEDFFQHFNDNKLNISFRPHESAESMLAQGKMVYESKNVIETILYEAVEMDAGKGFPEEIRILSDPIFTWIPEMLKNYPQSIRIEQVIPFHQYETVVDYKRDKNLNAFREVISTHMRLSANVSYNTYHFMTKADYADSTLFPFLFITSKYAFQISSNYEMCIVISDTAAIEKLKQMFDKTKDRSQQLLKGFSNVPEQLKYCLNIEMQSRKTPIGYQSAPCLVPYIDTEIMEKHVIGENEEKSGLIRMMDDYISMIKNLYRHNKPTYICSLDGIKNFMVSGRLDEFPDCLYTPLDVEECCRVVRSWMADIDTLQTVCILKNHKKYIKRGIYIFVTDTAGYVEYRGDSGENYILGFDYPDFVNSFRLYMEGFSESDFYTKEEAEEEILRMLE